MAARSKKWLAEALEATSTTNNVFERIEAKVDALTEYILSQVESK